MKRLFIYGAVLHILLLTGCVGGIERLPVAIGFDPVIGHDTRASEESMPFPEDRTFNVWATAAESNETILADETISHSSEGWVASAIWPETPVTFAAYYPSDLDVEYSHGRGVMIKDFNPHSGDADILIAKEVVVDSDAEGLVTLHFEHILSRVDFRVRQSLMSDMEVKVMKVEMVGFGLTGDYNIGKAHGWTTSSRDGSITVYDAAGGEGIPVDDAATYIGSEYFMIPQHCLAEIFVTFHVRVGAGGWVEDRVGTGSLDTDWQPGKQYTYTMNLTDTKMTYTTGISSWTSK